MVEMTNGKWGKKGDSEDEGQLEMDEEVTERAK